MGLGAALVVRGPAGRPRPHRPRHQPARDPGRGRRLDGVVRRPGRPCRPVSRLRSGPMDFADDLLRVRRAAARVSTRPDWLQQNRGWLARGMLAGEIDTCRAWLAMAAQVSRVVAGLPGPAGTVVGPGHDRVRHRCGGAVRREAGHEPAGQSPRRAGRSAGHDRRAGAARFRCRVRSVRTRTTRTTRTPRRPEVEIGDPQAELADLVGLAPIKQQVEAAGRRGAGRPAAARRRDARTRPLPAHGLHRQSRHGQDHGRPAAGPDLRPAGHAVQRPPGRGQPGRSGRPVHRPDRAEGPQGVQQGLRWRAVHRRGVLADSAATRTATSAWRRSPPCSS